jgi:uncharacterized protein (DUF58 family)
VASAPAAAPSAARPPDAPTPEQLLRRLEWDVIRRLDGLLQGDHRTMFRGGGIDLADLREYQLHDDVRHIDWNVTARLQAPHVRQFHEDRDLTAWFLLDLSGSVDFGSGDVTKLALSTGFVAVLARLLTRHGNRIGAVFYDRTVDAVLPPGASRLHVLRLLQRMRSAGRGARAASKAGAAATGAAAPRGGRRGDPGADPATGTALADLLRTADALMRRRCLVFVVSDFISTPGWAEALGRLARRHEVVAVRLLDPMEMALPDVGLVTLEDAETGEQLLVDASDPAFRARYEAIAAQQEEALFAALAGSGADTLELATDDDLLQSLLRYVDMRRQRARARSPLRFPAALRRASALPSTEASPAPHAPSAAARGPMP